MEQLFTKKLFFSAPDKWSKHKKLIILASKHARTILNAFLECMYLVKLITYNWSSLHWYNATAVWVFQKLPNKCDLEIGWRQAKYYASIKNITNNSNKIKIFVYLESAVKKNFKLRKTFTTIKDFSNWKHIK